MNIIRIDDLGEGADKDARLASLRRQLMKDITRQHRLVPASSRIVPNADVETPDRSGSVANGVESSSSSCSCTCSSESSCGSADMQKSFAARRKRSAISRMKSMSGSSVTTPASTEGNTVEDLSAKMSRLHSPMKTENEGNTVPPVAPQGTGRSLLFTADVPNQASSAVASFNTANVPLPLLPGRVGAQEQERLREQKTVAARRATKIARRARRAKMGRRTTATPKAKRRATLGYRNRLSRLFHIAARSSSAPRRTA